MYIKKITLKNFKSFGKKVEIPFFRGFTAISGPNGSGKSNIIDSIVFCLGLTSSTKALRAEKLTDLLYSGKNTSEAEVSITFDNSDSALPFDGDITVTRKIKITEKGYYSYYYLNGKPCNLSEIQDMFARVGIHGEAYNVIMQGDVTKITEMTPVQRRKIIDDIAGISEFEEKKEKALEELDRVRENIEKIEAILSEISSNLAQLEKDREEAIRYRSLLEEKEFYSKVVETHHYRLLLGKAEKLEREIQKLELDKDRLIHRMAELGRELEALNEKIGEISSKITEMTGESYAEINQRILEVTSEMESIRKSEELYQSEIEKLKDKLTEVNLAVSKLEEELNEHKNDCDRIAVEKESLQAVVDELEVKVSLLKDQMQEVDSRHRALRDELLREREDLEELKSKRSDLLREKDRLIESVRLSDVNLDTLKKKAEKSRERIEELNSRVDNLLKTINTAEMEASKLVKKRNDTDSKLFSLKDELAKIEEKIKLLEVELAKLRAEANAIESGFSKGVDLVLEARERRALPGIFGTVAQLCRVEERFAVALEVAAGNALQYIVVENEDDAVRAINYLKQIKGGRATFLPLNRIKRNFGKLELDASILGYPGVVDYAVNLVKCEKRFIPVFNYVFRDTLVVDRIETARTLMDRFRGRMVTLDGDLVERSGAMSGGYHERRKGFLLSKDLVEREKRILEEITVFKSKKSEIMAKIGKLEEERRDYQQQIDEKSAEVRRIREEIDSAKRLIADETEMLGELEKQIAEIEKEKRETSQKILELDGEIDKLSEEIAEKERKIKGIEKKLGDGEIPEITRKYEELKEELSAAYSRLMNAEKRLENAEFKKKQVEKWIEEKNRERERLKKEISEFEEKIRDGRKRVKELEEELRNLKEEEDRIGKNVRELRKERDELLEKSRKLEKDRDACKYAVAAVEERIKARKDSLMNVRTEIEKVDKNRLIEGEIPPMDEAIRKIEEIDGELKKFGDVNMKAIQDYEKVRSRRDGLLEKKLSLEKERSEILDRIEKYEKMKRDAFFETFNAVKENFSRVIKTLTDGEGNLYLDGEDPFNSGLNIKVKYYGKPVRRIEALSGGEKSLIALALIFAIQMYKPAPFYAFDEIDMFLDGANVGRVAKLIKERSKDAQFIVVSLRKPTLEMADAIVGVTMSRDNCSKVTGIKLKVKESKEAIKEEAEVEAQG